ncbi:MAG: COX15/CtaA family protein [Acidobacteriota bacterium]
MARSGLWLHRFAVLTASCTFLLIIAGALVTGNEAGLAVPDWPLSYGSLMPPMVGNIRYEHGHRMIASFVGFLTVILAVWIWRKEDRRFVRRLGGLALAAVVAQGILGGITVLFFLPVPVSVAHACLAQAFFCLVVSLAVLTSNTWNTPLLPDRPGDAEAAGLLQRYCWWLTAAIYVQLILGAALRHSKSGVLLHVLGALAVAFLVSCVLSLSRPFRLVSTIRLPAVLLGFLLVVQLFLGISSYLIREASRDDVQPALSTVSVTTAHLAAGALILAISVVLTLQTYRLPQSRSLTPHYARREEALS